MKYEHAFQLFYPNVEKGFRYTHANGVIFEVGNHDSVSTNGHQDMREYLRAEEDFRRLVECTHSNLGCYGKTINTWDGPLLVVNIVQAYRDLMDRTKDIPNMKYQPGQIIFPDEDLAEKTYNAYEWELAEWAEKGRNVE